MRHAIKQLLHLTYPMIILGGLGLLFRFFSFYPSVIAQEESIYMLVAREMLHGKHYYVDVIDTQPIGIFSIYLLFQMGVGKSIFLYRLLASLWAGFTAFGLFHLTSQRLKQTKMAWFVAISYLLLVSTYAEYGLSPNQGLYANGLIIWSLFLLTGGVGWWRYLLFGGLIGVVFIIQYSSGLCMLFLGLYFVWQAQKGWKNRKLQVFGTLLMVISFLLPGVVIYQYYHMIGYGDELLDTFQVGYSGPFRGTLLSQFGRTYLHFGRHFFPILPLAALGVAYGKSLTRSWYLLLLMWLCLTFFISPWIFPIGQSPDLMLAMLPLCILGAVGWFSKAAVLFNKERWLRYGGILILSTLLFSLTFRHKQMYLDARDTPAIIAQNLAPQLKPGDQLYTGNYEPILYFLLDKEMPTPYLRPFFLWNTNDPKPNIDLDKETQQILALNPRFLVLQKPIPDTPLSEALFLHYSLLEEMGDGIFIYERK